MERFLVIAHETASSTELTRALMEIATHAEATFDILVPATPVEHLLTWTEGETRAVALGRAADASSELRKAGLTVGSATVGDPDPLAAIEDHLRKHPGTYDGLVIATHPPRLSRWLKVNLVNKAAKLTGLPVTHVVAQTAVARSGVGS